jgi:hypothetical protein
MALLFSSTNSVGLRQKELQSKFRADSSACQFFGRGLDKAQLLGMGEMRRA